MRRRVLPWSPAVALLVGVAALYVGLLAAGGASFVASDETYAFLLARSPQGGGPPSYPLPYVDVAERGFAPLGSGGGGHVVADGISPFFVGAFAPLARMGEAWVLAAMVAVSTILVAGTYGVGAFLADPRGGLLAGAAIAFAPPILFFGGLFFANVPVLAAFAVSTWALGMFVARGRLEWLVASWVALACAILLRLDTIPLGAPFLAVVAVSGFRRPAVWLAIPVVLYATVSMASLATNLEPSLGDALIVTPTDVENLQAFFHAKWVAMHPELKPEVLERNTRAYVFGAAPVLGILGGAGILLLRHRDPARAALVAGLVVSASAYVATYLFWDLGPPDPPGLFSSLVRYTLIVPFALALGAGTLLAAASRQLKGRASAVWAVGATLCLVVPGVTQAALAEPGLAWIVERRSAFVEIDRRAGLLPENAYLVGDDPSKYVFSRRVLVPSHVPQPETSIPTIIDGLASKHNLSAYVYVDNYRGDWSGVIGEYVTDASHYVTPSAVDGFLAVERTNSTLLNVGVLEKGAWSQTPEGLLASGAPRSLFKPTPALADELGLRPTPAVTISFTVRDDVPGWHEAGYVNSPGRPEDAVVTHRWNGTGGGSWRTETIFLPADTIMNGHFFVPGGLVFRELRVEPSTGVAER